MMTKEKLRRLMTVAGLVILVAGGVYGVYWFVTFLHTSPKFNVQKMSAPGIKRVTENEVLGRIGYGIGVNIFKVSLDEIRLTVESIPWVRHAVVRRVLPDEIVIRITERQPVGIARIRGEIYQIDEDAAILTPDPEALSNFPILNGLSESDSVGNVPKVRAYQRVLEALPQNDLSEIHVNTAGEVSVISTTDSLEVNLGTDDFRMRWIRYLQLKGQIREQYPQATSVDLRFRNQVIIRLGDQAPENSVTWDETKKSL